EANRNGISRSVPSVLLPRLVWRYSGRFHRLPSSRFEQKECCTSASGKCRGSNPVKVRARVRGGTEIGEVDRQGGPMEPPIGYGSTHRSIFPESQFRKDGGSVFRRAGRGRKKLIGTSARRPAARGARGHSVLNRHKVRMTEAFPITAWVKDITGHSIAPPRIGGAGSVRRCGLRCDRDDLDLVLDPKSHRGAHGDAEGSQTGRAVAFRRARPVTGNQDCSLAASVDTILEADQRGLSSRSQDG